MSYKKKHQVTGKLITSGLRSGFSEMSTSPTTPLEVKILSPTGLIDCEMSGIGLGIVAALENSRVNIPAKKSNFRCRNPMEEDYMITTSHKTEKSCRNSHCVTTKLIEIRDRDRDRPSIFDISPTRSGDDDVKRCTAFRSLSSCHLCNKILHGKDIYMYREKPFCGPECRSRQIGMDERREKHCNSQASSSSNDISPNVLPTGIFAI